MNKLCLLAAAAIGLASAPVAAAPILDGFRVTVGGTTFAKTSSVDGGILTEDLLLALFAPTPAGFTGGLVVLTEADGSTSDEFALFSIPIIRRLTAVLLSDPFLIPPFVLPVRTLTIGETGSFQSVGNFFGFADNAAVQVISDVPEPATLVLLGSGLAGLILTRRRKA